MSTTAFEKKIREYADEHGHQISKSKVQRLALRLVNRGQRMADLDLERILMYSDPTPRDAIRNVMREQLVAV